MELENAEEISDELIERFKELDDRYSLLEAAIEIESEVNNSRFWGILKTLLDDNEEKALKDLAVVTPSDTPAIVNLQARVYRAQFVRDTFEAIRRKGKAAQESLEQDRQDPDG
ncbi:MAG TPA: hypothetical protein VJQ82_08740 [Terriglobales bacterium]|nr:hypothetical protein [Terriglobales bacterium]